MVHIRSWSERIRKPLHKGQNVSMNFGSSWNSISNSLWVCLRTPISMTRSTHERNDGHVDLAGSKHVLWRRIHCHSVRYAAAMSVQSARLSGVFICIWKNNAVAMSRCGLRATTARRSELARYRRTRPLDRKWCGCSCRTHARHIPREWVKS